MVLVDTSVWVRFLQRKEPYDAELDRLLGLDGVTGHEFIFGELLAGDTGTRSGWLGLYSKIDQVATVKHDELISFVRGRRLHGRGIGWVDLHLLASCLVAKCTLWTADQRLSLIAQELGVNHRMQA